ncbi:unnamed protein product [Polarella glacialis]|uniref:Uncharacterized protein n=1 Tax=Polarella glacialis TaxID=89957 RepID=A0A813KR32_POLGL|nr:unnamed protein product [Polarella glacialis]CAE8705807.1 unnamed protein product [Polarella glacialis]
MPHPTSLTHVIFVVVRGLDGFIGSLLQGDLQVSGAETGLLPDMIQQKWKLTTFQVVSRGFGVFQGVSRCFRLFQVVSGCFRLFQAVSGCFSLLQIVSTSESGASVYLKPLDLMTCWPEVAATVMQTRCLW